MSVPVLLAFAGTALIAVAIFYPFRSSMLDRRETHLDPNDAYPHWPELVEPSAHYCDAAARLDLVDALATLGSPWALGVLEKAGEEESDPRVCAAIASALGAPAAAASNNGAGYSSPSIQSRVT